MANELDLTTPKTDVIRHSRRSVFETVVQVFDSDDRPANIPAGTSFFAEVWNQSRTTMILPGIDTLEQQADNEVFLRLSLDELALLTGQTVRLEIGTFPTGEPEYRSEMVVVLLQIV